MDNEENNIKKTWHITSWLERDDYPLERTITDGNGCKIASKVSKQDASLIVKAVNEYAKLKADNEALLEACRRAYLLLDSDNNHGMGKRTDALSYEVYQDLEQAIKQAEGCK